MKTDKLSKILIDLGLSENEAKVYLAAMALGPSSISKIAQSAGVKRTTVYFVIESLKQIGLINIEMKGWKKLFVAEKPEKLKIILENKKKELAKALPEFTSLYNLKESGSFIKFYEGVESIKSIYEGLIRDIRTGEDYMILSDMKQWVSLDKKYFMDFTMRRAKLNINIRLLLQDSSVARETKKYEKIYNEKVKILPKDTNLTTNMIIIPKRLVIQQLVPPVTAMVIENEHIIRMHREMYEIMWRATK